MTKVQKSDAEWRAELTPEQYDVLRRKGTEAPFTGRYAQTKEEGTYRCAGCGAPLFEKAGRGIRLSAAIVVPKPIASSAKRTAPSLPNFVRMLVT